MRNFSSERHSRKHVRRASLCRLAFHGMMWLYEPTGGNSDATSQIHHATGQRTRRRGDRVRRRDVIALLGAALVVLPRAAHSQQPTVPVIGFLSSASPDKDGGRLRAFRAGLGEAGFVEGRNVAFEYRWAEEKVDRLPALAADLIARKVAVIVQSGEVHGAVVAKAATTTIPIVFTTARDPVQLGLVASLNRPGGNVTGVTTLSAELEPKRLEILQGVVPAATTFGALLNPASPNAEVLSKTLQVAAAALGVKLHIVHARAEGELDKVFASLAEMKAGGLVIASDGLFISRGDRLGELSLRHAVPAIFQFRAFAAAGGLMSYGADLVDLYRQSGLYAGRILKGEKPADLPVMQATRVELIINMKTAKALGIELPLPLLGRADEVIE
jgi:putative ABC transport system substrate-binding protein